MEKCSFQREGRLLYYRPFNRTALYRIGDGDIAGIWQRWSSYADVTNLTGGNKAFEELKNNGADYIVENFSYSILEIFDMRTKREDIIQRESYWKRVFQTIKYGMNNN